MATELENAILSKYKTGLVAYINDHPEYFEEAVDLALSDKKPYCWRAASLVGDYITFDDKKIKKHIGKIVKALQEKEDGHQRELLKILLKMNLNQKQAGVVFDICIGLWESIQKQPSVRITAMRMIFKFAESYPELENEIAYLFQEHYLETLSPGVKHSIKKMLKNKKQNMDLVFSEEDSSFYE